MHSPPCSPICCPACQMFSYSKASFSDNGTCNTCRQLASLEARISDLESRFHVLANNSNLASASPIDLASVDSPDSSPPSQLASQPAASPSQQGQWVTVRRSSRGTKSQAHHQPLQVSNRFSPLSNPPNQDKALVIGASTVRNVKLAFNLWG